MTNQEIVFMAEGLAKLREKQDVQLPARVAFSIAYNIKLLIPIIDSIQDIKTEILQRYGTKKNDGSEMYDVSSEVVDQVNQELKNLANMDMELELKKISMKDIEDIKLSITDIEALYPMLEEG